MRLTVSKDTTRFMNSRLAHRNFTDASNKPQENKPQRTSPFCTKQANMNIFLWLVVQRYMVQVAAEDKGRLTIVD